MSGTRANSRVSWHFLFAQAPVATFTDLSPQVCLAEGQWGSDSKTLGGQRLPGNGARLSTLGSFSTRDSYTLRAVCFPPAGWTQPLQGSQPSGDLDPKNTGDYDPLKPSLQAELSIVICQGPCQLSLLP